MGGLSPHRSCGAAAAALPADMADESGDLATRKEIGRHLQLQLRMRFF
jgi:hypothetical protein